MDKTGITRQVSETLCGIGFLVELRELLVRSRLEVEPPACGFPFGDGWSRYTEFQSKFCTREAEVVAQCADRFGRWFKGGAHGGRSRRWDFLCSGAQFLIKVDAEDIADGVGAEGASSSRA